MVKCRDAEMVVDAPTALDVATWPEVVSAALAADERPDNPNRKAAARTVQVSLRVRFMVSAPWSSTAEGLALVELVCCRTLLVLRSLSEQSRAHCPPNRP